MAMMSNAEFKKKMIDGKPMLGMVLNLSSPLVAEAASLSGYGPLPVGHSLLAALLSCV